MKKQKWILLILGILLTANAWALEFSPYLLQKLNRIYEIKTQGRTPVAIFDLDETVINTDQRMLLSTLAALPDMASRYPQEVQLTSQVTIADFRALENSYSVEELLQGLGVTNGRFIQELAERRLNIYLSPEYVSADTSIHCANHWVRALFDLGTKVYFVSSRYLSLQGQETVNSLFQNGFIRESDDFAVLLRPDGMGSIEFKRASFQYITDRLGPAHAPDAEVAFVFENEPENINAMVEYFPLADAFFIPGAFVQDEPLKSSIVRLPTESYCQ